MAMNHVHVHFQPRTKHADRIGDAILAVHKKMLADGVNDAVFRGQINCFGVLDHVLDIVVGNFTVGGHHRMHAAIIETTYVRTGDTEINVPDLDIGHLLGLDDGIADVLLGLGRINDLAFAHTAGARLAEADDVQAAAGRVGVSFADDGAYLGRADFQTDNDG